MEVEAVQLKSTLKYMKGEDPSINFHSRCMNGAASERVVFVP